MTDNRSASNFTTPPKWFIAPIDIKGPHVEIQLPIPDTGRYLQWIAPLADAREFAQEILRHASVRKETP